MAETVIMPKLGFDMAEGTLVRWVIQEGETVEKGAVLAEIETDKATVEVDSNFSGVIFKHLVQAGDVVPINTPIAIIASPGEEPDLSKIGQPSTNDRQQAAETGAALSAGEQSEAQQTAADTESEARLPGGMRASPLARRMAAQMHININQIIGSGLNGRIVAKDIEEYLSAPARRILSNGPETDRVSQGVQGTGYFKVGETRIEKLSKLRAAIGRRMQEAKQQIPHFYVTHEYDAGPVLTLRKQVNETLTEDQKISVNDFIVKAAALTLREFPNLNASLQGDEIVQHGFIHIGVAVAVQGGLLTVVCRDADHKSLLEIAQDMKQKADRARDFKVKPDDIEGSTFSISNLGMFAVEDFSAIINPPEAAILAVSTARELPVVKNGELTIGWRMKATISVDHRISDGAEAARFMQSFAEYIEQPIRLLL